MKLRKFPKRPKQSASLEIWKKWERKYKEVNKHNAAIRKDYETRRKLGGGSSSATLVTLPPKNTPPTLSNAKKLK
jgi:hypothetical protein